MGKTISTMPINCGQYAAYATVRCNTRYTDLLALSTGTWRAGAFWRSGNNKTRRSAGVLGLRCYAASGDSQCEGGFLHYPQPEPYAGN